MRIKKNSIGIKKIFMPIKLKGPQQGAYDPK
jgi:hypothetical protein